MFLIGLAIGYPGNRADCESVTFPSAPFRIENPGTGRTAAPGTDPKYGPKSEKLSDNQLQLLELEPGVSTEEVEAESRRGPLPAASPATAPAKSKSARHPGRQELPAHLPRVERVIPCTPEQGVCQSCGKDKAVIGHEQSEQLDVEPARYFVVVTRREKRACKTCSEGVSAAPLPERIIAKSLVSDRVVIDTIVNKYSDHLPLYRQSAILERDTGVSISRATMDGWILRAGEMLIPVVGAMGRELIAGSYIQADETPVPVQMSDGRGKDHQAFLWQYGTPGGNVVFDFRMGRSREGPVQFLGQYEGILQTDGYAAYGRVGGSRMVHAACWAHARRKVFDAVKLHPGDRMAAQLVARIDELFAVDAEARNAGMDHDARHALRGERSRPLLAAMKKEMLAAQVAVLPASALGKAVSYTLSLWDKLTRFLEHPELELSNNSAENSMRPVVLGRQNWIHVGSEQAGPKVAAILSVVETCRRLKLPVRKYLAWCCRVWGTCRFSASVSTRLLPGRLPAAENTGRGLIYGVAAFGIEAAGRVGIRCREANLLPAIPKRGGLSLLRVG